MDEEVRNFIDDDGDGLVDEDLSCCPVDVDPPPPVILSSCLDHTQPKRTGRPRVVFVSESCIPVSITRKDVATNDACRRTIRRQWTATDSCGNVDTDTQTITVEDRTPPSLLAPHNRTVSCSEYGDPAAVGSPRWNDDCGSNVTTWYEDELNGCIVWRTWKALDECKNSATAPVQTLKLVVEAPTVSFPGDMSVTCLNSSEPMVTGRPVVAEPDLCGWNASGVVTMYHTDAEVELQGCHRLLTRSWRVADVCGNEVKNVQNITILHRAPGIRAPPDATSTCSATGKLELLGRATIMESCKPVNISYVDSLDGPTLKRQWTSVDSCGSSSSSHIQVITIEEDAPQLLVPSNVTIRCHESAHPNATGWAVLENDLNEACFRLGGTPTVLGYVDERNGAVCPGVIHRQWQATSFLGHTVSAIQVIGLGCSPSLTIPADREDNDCDARVDEESRNYIDDDGDGLIDEDLATFPIVVNPLPPVSLGSLTSPSSPAYTGRPAIARVSDGCKPVSLHHKDHVDGTVCLRNITRNWIVRDACRNVEITSQTIVIRDSTPPTLSVPGDAVVSCSDYNLLNEATATDDSNVSMSYFDEVNGCVVSRTWHAVDYCGNAAGSQVQTITMNIDPPTVTFPPNTTVTCLDSAGPSQTGRPVVVAASLCGRNVSAAVTVKYVDTTRQMDSCDQAIYRQWDVVDVCGNRVSALQAVRVLHQAPVLRRLPDLTSTCINVRSDYNVGTDSLVSFCGHATVSHSSKLKGSTVVRKWIATDECGRHAVPHIQTIHLHEEPPTLVVPRNVTVKCHESTHPNVTGWATISKDLDSACFNLGGDATTIEYEDLVNTVGCPGQLFRRWKAKTFMGHTVVAEQIIALGI